MEMTWRAICERPSLLSQELERCEAEEAEDFNAALEAWVCTRPLYGSA